MKARSLLAALLGLVVLLGSAAPVLAQRQPYGVEEYNAFVDTTRPQDPAPRLDAIDAFLKQYPESVLRAFVYPAMAQTAFQLQRHAKVLEAVDGLLEMNRDQVASLYKQSNYTDLHIDNIYYQALVLYTFSFLQSFRNGTPQADALAERAAEHARQGLELHQKLYGQVQPPDDPAKRKQFDEQKNTEEASFHNLLAFVAWRKEDYSSAAREYAAVVKLTPNDPLINYRTGLASLRQSTPDYPAGIWHVARAISLKITKSEEVKDYLTKVVSGYQQVVPTCAADQVDDILQAAAQSATPPPGWRLVDASQVNAVRNELTVKRIFDDLKAGGEQEHLIWLASCGLELPELEGEVLEASQTPENSVTLGVAVTQEAADAKQPDITVKVIAPPEAKNLKAGDVVHFTGIVDGYQKDPFFQLKLKDGKVKAEDIPKAAPARRGAGAGR